MQITAEIIQKVIENLAKENEQIEFIPRAVLTGLQAVISVGNKRYYSPDLKAGDVTLYEIPETEIILRHTPFEVVFDYIKRID